MARTLIFLIPFLMMTPIGAKPRFTPMQISKAKYDAGLKHISEFKNGWADYQIRFVDVEAQYKNHGTFQLTRDSDRCNRDFLLYDRTGAQDRTPNYDAELGTGGCSIAETRPGQTLTDDLAKYRLVLSEVAHNPNFSGMVIKLASLVEPLFMNVKTQSPEAECDLSFTLRRTSTDDEPPVYELVERQGNAICHSKP